MGEGQGGRRMGGGGGMGMSRDLKKKGPAQGRAPMERGRGSESRGKGLFSNMRNMGGEGSMGPKGTSRERRDRERRGEGRRTWGEGKRDEEVKVNDQSGAQRPGEEEGQTDRAATRRAAATHPGG